LIDTNLFDPWYWQRLRGFAQNPTQLALFCAVLVLLSLHLAETANGWSERIAAIACAILPIYVGRLTKSDAFTVVLVAAGPTLLTIKIWAWLLSSERKAILRHAFALIAVIALPLMLASSVPIIFAFAHEAEGLAMGLAKDHGEGATEEAQLRFSIWRQAIDRGIESGMLGLGPGPHLEIPQVLVAARRTEAEPKYIEHPEVNGTANFEAHNTVLDLFTQGGIIAVLSFVGLAAIVLFTTFKARLAALTTLVCGLGIFSMFHLIIRQPIFWFTIALCLVAGHTTSAPTVVREGR
jgi:O-antigen ligase